MQAWLSCTSARLLSACSVWQGRGRTEQLLPHQALVLILIPNSRLRESVGSDLGSDIGPTER